jgi:hypothetical protein
MLVESKPVYLSYEEGLHQSHLHHPALYLLAKQLLYAQPLQLVVAVVQVSLVY